MTRPTIVLAGAAGDLGGRIAKALVARGAAVRALVRDDASTADRGRLAALGLEVAPADVADVGSVARACDGAACVVSALNGLRDVIVGRQGVLLDAAVGAGVPRFIPSDYSADFTKTRPGDNRNLDLRREFMARADRAPIRATSILNGAFMDMLGAEMPIIQPRIRRVLHWGSADQPLDFTTKDDVAAYAAAVALDEAPPRILRIAGDAVSARGIARTMTEATGERYRTLWAGGTGSLGVLIRLAKTVAPQPTATFPPWQGMQYMRDMFSGRGKLHPLDNDRYPGLRWTPVREQLAAQPASASRQGTR
ncbi:MAG: Isoflavone reductase homolog P3 [uncultured Gemmatimonadaceae bacterium]|uniref:Isoflavone reductase homolog P3 n=1 Tax=uncultured Gemmatimonadaceae bacterium TaxID=246130 RepID=A0A6J4M0N3_9BACT|nr:MAG: Isoflavone reductase homolog P3 [uncultured Gemmatimonadaceae bacterium]